MATVKKNFWIVPLLMFALAWAALSLHNVPPARAQFSGPQTWAGTAGGSSTALTLNVHNVATLNDLLGVPIKFIPSAVSVGPTTLTINLDGGGTLTPTAIARPTSNVGFQAPSGSELTTSVMAEVTYDGNRFVITSNVDMTPVGQAVDLRQNATTAPAGYLLEDGTCYANTTYAALDSVIGTTYNSGAPVGCSGSQFAVPFSNGTLSAAMDNQGVNGAANRITNAGSGCNAVSIIGCGTQSQTLTLAQLPTGITSSGNNSITVVSTGSLAVNPTIALTFGLGGADGYVPGTVTTATSTGTNAISVTSGNTSGQAHPILPPIIIVRRAIKA
jgi:Phage Tail Collar Domain